MEHVIIKVIRAVEHGKAGMTNPRGGVDPTRSTGRRDSLLNGRKMIKMKRKCGLIFEFWKICPRGGQFFFGVATYFLLLFYKGENQVRTKKTQ